MELTMEVIFAVVALSRVVLVTVPAPVSITTLNLLIWLSYNYHH